MEKLQLLVIHCTATQEGTEISSDQIRAMHLSPPPAGRGWKQVGYSDMIHLDGEIENLVPYDEDEMVEPWEITNGVVGLNAKARHVVYVGGVDKYGRPKDTRTNSQKVSLESYVRSFIQHHLTCKVAGHYHFANKACPSFDVEKWLEYLNVPKMYIYRKP